MANILEAVKDIVESLNENSETKQELSTLKKEIAEKVVKKFESEQWDVFLSIGKDLVADYLVDEGWTDKLHDNLVEKGMESLIASAPQLKEIREKLNKAKTTEQLKSLESEILGKSSLEKVNNETPSNNVDAEEENQTLEQGDQNVENPQTTWEDADYQENIPEAVASNTSYKNQENLDVSELPREQQEHINAVIQTAQKQIGKPYSRWGVWPSGFDCSGLWNYAFKEQGITFKDRFTAALFSKTDVDIQRDQVRVGDFMYRDRKPGSNKHSPIYHIEMVVDKPFFKDGKWYVKTLGASTDKGVLNEQGNPTKKKGVGYRLREVQSYRHFGRPPYYLQLAQHQKNGNSDTLIASNQSVDSHTKEQLMA